MKETFVNHKFSDQNYTMIDVINKILDDYNEQGYRLTLRQLYYQLVSRDLIQNNLKSYKNIGNLVSDGRQAGLIDWRMIEDRNRETTIPSHWDNPGQIVAAAANQFKIDKWENQPYHIEVMVEKDALSGVLEPVCFSLDIGITANKGYSSSSTMYDIGKRLMYRNIRDSKKILVLYLGDHDPSGIDMTRDVEDRLLMYSTLETVQVERLALNYDQIEQWRPPANPAKMTDSRFVSYEAKFGNASWELDAVEPRQLAALVTEVVLRHRDEHLWDEAVAKENKMKAELKKFAEGYVK